MRNLGSLGLQRHVAGHDHDRDAALSDGDAHRALQDLRQLVRTRDQFDIMAAFLEQALRVRRLEIIEPISVLGIWAAMASTGTPLRWQSNRPLIRCRLPGPQLPAQTASSPVRCASAPAAKAALSSWRMCIHSIASCAAASR